MTPRLDFRLRNNFAVEFWFKLESVPEIPFQQGTNREAMLSLSLRRQFSRKGSYGSFRCTLPQQPKKVEVIGISPGEWHHFSFQTWLEGGIRHSAAYYNGGIPNEQNLPVKMWCVDTDSRFYIGGLPQEAIEGLAEAGLPYAPFASAPIYLDEVRLSIAPVGKPQLDAPPEPTPRTKALWHFSEGPDASTYKDNTGANTLFRQPLSVSAKRALATTWGRLKFRGF